MQNLDPGTQDLRPSAREVWERLAPDDRDLVRRAWRFFADEGGESPLWLRWSMELAGVLEGGWEAIPDDISRLSWMTREFLDWVPKGQSTPWWPPVDDQGPAVVPEIVFMALGQVLPVCEVWFHWQEAAWWARNLGWAEASDWIEDHPGEYLLGVYQGFWPGEE